MKSDDKGSDIPGDQADHDVIGPPLATTHALFADDVERKVSNALARFRAS
jgi:hypothetical protein